MGRVVAAPELDCDICQRGIAKRRIHFKLRDNRVVCSRCFNRHELHGELDCYGTRAAMAILLGVWP